MTSVFRISVSKFGSGGICTRLCKVSNTHNVVPAASMVRDAFLDEKLRPKPFPYWKKSLTGLDELLDPMMKRFYENSRLIIIDGPPAAGKSKLAEQLADQFKMLYMPAPTHDEIYIDQYGFDQRTLDPKLPPGAQSADLIQFLANPKEKGAYAQFQFLQMRLEQYMNALLHILSTGQGVVLNRCFFSDSVFQQSMYSMGYISKKVLDYFKAAENAVAAQLMRPHLVIYLDVPAETVKDNIRKRGIPHEVNSEVFTTQYLSEIEKNYKESYLTNISSHSHLLMYDWSKEHDTIQVVEEIEDLDFDSQIDPNGKLGDWIFTFADEAFAKRRVYSERRELITDFGAANDFERPEELQISGADSCEYELLCDELNVEQYEPGFNPDFGDKVLTKLKPKGLAENYSFRAISRDFVNRDKSMT